jgi:hypothetical protein
MMHHVKRKTDRYKKRMLCNFVVLVSIFSIGSAVAMDAVYSDPGKGSGMG